MFGVCFVCVLSGVDIEIVSTSVEKKWRTYRFHFNNSSFYAEICLTSCLTSCLSQNVNLISLKIGLDQSLLVFERRKLNTKTDKIRSSTAFMIGI